MANEATAIEITGAIPHNWTIGDEKGLEKGHLMWIDPNGTRTASGATSVNQPFAGILSTEKVAADGSTTAGLYDEGIWDCTATGIINSGAFVMISGANTVGFWSGVFQLSGASIMGRACEGASDGEVVNVKLGM